MGVRPSYFVNETAAIAMVARAMQASASVSSVTLAHATFELFRQTELDTAENQVVNQGRSKVKLTTRLTLKGARYMSANLGSAPGTGSTDLTFSVKGTERAQLAATAANCVGRYAAHCEVKVEQNFHMEKAEVGQPRSPRVPLPATSWQRSVKISGMPHTTSLTTIGDHLRGCGVRGAQKQTRISGCVSDLGDLRGYFALPPRVPAGPFLLGTEDEERLYVRDEFYYWKVKQQHSARGGSPARPRVARVAPPDFPSLPCVPVRSSCRLRSRKRRPSTSTRRSPQSTSRRSWRCCRCRRRGKTPSSPSRLEATRTTASR